MNDASTVDSELLQRVLALTPVGRHELQDPQWGLSLPQRWLLGRLDGDSALMALARLPGSPAAQRLPRDAAKLVALGLAQDVGDPGPSAEAFGPNTQYGEITLPLPLDMAPSAPPMVESRPQVKDYRPPAQESRLPVTESQPSVEESILPPMDSWRPELRPAPARRAFPLALVAGAASVLMAAGAGIAFFGASSGDPEPVVTATGGALPAAGQAVAPLSSADAGLRLSSVAPPVPAPTPSASTVVPASTLSVPAARPAIPGSLLDRRANAAPTLPPVPPAVQVPPRSSTAALSAANAAPVLSGAAVATPTLTRTVPLAIEPTRESSAPSGNSPVTALVTTTLPAVALPPAPTPAAGPAPVLSAGATPAAPSPAANPNAAAPAPAPLRPLSIVEPIFPREGFGTRSVSVQARMVVAPNGNVTQVSFPQTSLNARPFERAARSALLQWRFPPGADERVVMQILQFTED